MTEWGIDTLFNPGKRHMDEEKRRLQSTREEVGDSSGGRRIDLESGSVTISRRSKNGPPADTEDEVAQSEAAESGAAEDEAPEDEPAASEVAKGEAAADEAAESEAAAEADRSASQE
jgi:uncharacterized protein DUF6191